MAQANAFVAGNESAVEVQGEGFVSRVFPGDHDGCDMYVVAALIPGDDYH